MEALEKEKKKVTLDVQKEEEKDAESEKSQASTSADFSSDEIQRVGKGLNPYVEFLDNIGEHEEEEEGSGLMGGLKSWLGFAGSMTGTGGAVVGEPQAAKPWVKGEKAGEDTMTRKAEENMSKIAGDFCNWLRDLPGEDKTVNQMGESHLRSLFDTAQSANPGTTKLAEGLRSWAKFGSTVTGAENTKRGIVDQVQPLLSQKKFVEKLLGIKGGLKRVHLEPKKPREESKRDRMLYYGAWYVEPKDWQKRFQRQVETIGGTKIEDKTKGKLKAALPGQVDMMGVQQPVSQLQATKAFGQYLNERKNYKKPNFIKHILKSNEKAK